MSKVIYYARSPLLILPVAGSSLEEVLRFLNDHGENSSLGEDSYEFVDSAEDASNSVVFRIRKCSDRSTIIGLSSSTVILHDPDIGGVQLLHSMNDLERYGVNLDAILQSGI